MKNAQNPADGLRYEAPAIAATELLNEGLICGSTQAFDDEELTYSIF